MRPGRRALPVAGFDAATGRWAPLASVAAVPPGNRSELVLTTFNVWFDELHAGARYRATADLLGGVAPDILVFQEATPALLDVVLSQDWVRENYLACSITGDTDSRVGNYGMLLLSRLPVDRVTYTPLPTHLDRGYLRADLTVNGAPLTVCSVHLDSGRRSARLRGRQLRTLFRAVRGADDVVLLGDFNMRDAENGRIAAPYRDVWPVLRPGEHGYTEDTSVNLMRYDSKDKHRHVRFDRVLVKGGRWQEADIDLLGTEPISPDLPRVFPSDHFGVRCRLTAASTPARRAPRWWLRLTGGR